MSISNSEVKGASFFMTASFLWLSHFFVDFMLTIWPVFKTINHMNLALAGFMAGVSALLGESMQLFFGALSDKGFAKRILLFGLFLALMNGFLPYTENPLIIFFLLLMTFIGSGAFHPAAFCTLSALKKEGKKGLLFSFFASGGAFGQMLSPLLFTFLFFSYPNLLFLLFIPPLLAALCYLASKGAQIPTGKARQKITFSLLKAFFSTKPLAFCYLFQLANQMIYWTIVFLLPDILSVKGYPQSFTFGGGLLSLFLGNVLFMVPAGYLADKIGHKKMLLFGTLSGAVSLYTLLFYPGLTVAETSVLLFVTGASFGSTQPLLISLANIYTPGHPGVVSAFLMGLVWCVAECFGPLFGGFFAQNLGPQGPILSLALISSVSLCSLTTLLLMPEEKEQPREQFHALLQ